MTDTSEPADPSDIAETAGPSKLDPILRERLDTRSADAPTQPDEHDAGDGDDVVVTVNDPALEPEQLEVMVALVAPPTSDDIDALADRGLTVRSAIGDILTGVVAIDAVEHLADYDAILKIESSTPLGLEEPSGTSDGTADEGFDVNDFVE